MNKLDKICVFCGSNEGNDTMIIDVSKQLGKKLAKNNITLVYGAAKIGVMGVVAKAALKKKGQVIGVIPEFLKNKEVVAICAVGGGVNCFEYVEPITSVLVGDVVTVKVDCPKGQRYVLYYPKACVELRVC